MATGFWNCLGPPGPPMEELWQRAVSALSKGEQPNFSDVNPIYIAEAFDNPWFSSGIDEKWLTTMKEEIERLSYGKVHLEDASPGEEVPGKYWLVRNLVLVSQDKRQKVTLTNIGHPFTFSN